MNEIVTPEVGKNVVTLRRVCQYVKVSPPAECLEILRTTHYAPFPLPGAGRVVASVPQPMYEDRDDGAGETAQFLWAGLQPAVRAALEAAGHAVRVEGPVPAPLPPPDLVVLRQLRLIDLPVLEAVRARDRCLIQYDGRAGVDRANLIAQVAQAWPDRTIVVAVKRVDDVRRVCTRLGPLLPDVTALSGDDHPPAFGRVVVATFNYCYIEELAPSERDVFFAYDALEFAGQQQWHVPKYFTKARLYGLLDVDGRPAPALRDRLVALFGFDDVLVPQHGYRLRPVVPLEVKYRPRAGGGVGRSSDDTGGQAYGDSGAAPRL